MEEEVAAMEVVEALATVEVVATEEVEEVVTGAEAMEGKHSLLKEFNTSILTYSITYLEVEEAPMVEAEEVGGQEGMDFPLPLEAEEVEEAIEWEHWALVSKTLTGTSPISLYSRRTSTSSIPPSLLAQRQRL